VIHKSTYCADFMKSNPSGLPLLTTKYSLQTQTEIDGGFLLPGTPYFVRIAAINDAGMGEFSVAHPSHQATSEVSVTPGAPPGIPTAAFISAVPKSFNSLFVEWENIGFGNGAPVISFTIEVATAQNFSGHMFLGWDKIPHSVIHYSFDNPLLTTFSAHVQNLTCGVEYVVGVRAWNFFGPGGPVWYKQLKKESVRIATPVCPKPATQGCIEPSGSIPQGIIVRALPSSPVVNVPLISSLAAPSHMFTSSSVVVQFASVDTCVATTSWKIQWSPSRDLAKLNTSTVVVFSEKASTGIYNISNLTTGSLNFIRITSSNSLGFGRPSQVLTFIPMQSPDCEGLIPSVMQSINTSIKERITTLNFVGVLPQLSAPVGEMEGMQYQLTLLSGVNNHGRILIQQSWSWF